jgi:hypothetical protein
MKPHRIAYRFASVPRSYAAALVVFAGCSSIHDAIGEHPVMGAESDAGSAPLDSGRPAMCPVDELTPPAIVLGSSAGDQTGAQSSFCTKEVQRGCGVCADYASRVPKQFTIVHSGDSVTFGMPDGTLVTPGPDQCQPACPPQVAIKSLCSNHTNERAFTEDEAWIVDLTPGVYQLDVGAMFEADDLSGQTADTFGLIVDDARARGIVEAAAPGTTCVRGDGSP